MTTKLRRVAITGIGLITPLGCGVDSTWNALLRTESGVDKISLFDAGGFPTQIAAEVKGDDLSLLPNRKLQKKTARAHRFALAAAEQAIRDAGIKPNSQTEDRWGCSVGAGMMNFPFDELRQLHQEAGEDGHIDTNKLLDSEVANNPMLFYRSQVCTAVALLTQIYGIRGFSTSMHTACASGGQAVGAGMKLIGNGTCDYVLAGGFDSMISPVGIAGFSLLNAISTDNDRPHHASRPFDATRNGFVLGEGAGFLVLEEWTAARDRGAYIYAELAGEGNSLSSYRVTDSHPSGDGPIQAMEEALRCAHSTPEEIDYINAHGTSTLMNDRCEAAAIRQVFGEHASTVAVSSTKSMMGHLIAAAGAVEAAVCALAIDRSQAPANANLQDQDPECDLNLVLEKPREMPIQMAMSNSFGFGGTNNCLVFRNPRVEP